jgi:uncharacterized membrane protein YdjX (TVP38/TMEM64 family)
LRREEEKKVGPNRQQNVLVALFLAAITLIALVLFFGSGSWKEVISDPQANRLQFLLLMLVLPIFGVSIVLFLVFVGIKFGTLGGLLISGLFMLFHMLVAYLVSHSILRPYIDRFLGEHHWARPRLPPDKKLLYAILFAAIPGLPYAVKNYLLALAGLPFWRYLLVCWTVQLAMGIPFVVLGEAIRSKHAGVLFAAAAILAGVLWIGSRLRRKFYSSPSKEL